MDQTGAVNSALPVALTPGALPAGGVELPAENVAAYLTRMAQVQPEVPALILQLGPGRYREIGFLELDRASGVLAAGLCRYGLGRGVRTALLVRPGFDFFALTFGLFKAGAVPVLIDPGIGLANLGRCLTEAQPEGFIGIPSAQLARILGGWARGTLRRWVTVGPRLGWGGVTLGRIRRWGEEQPGWVPAAPGPDETAAILFTSGSTGVPKGALYTQAIFLEQIRALRELYGIQPGERDLATFPLFALFGPALGMTVLVPRMDATRPARADPALLVEAIQRYQATNMFGSPALLNTLGRYGVSRGVRLPSLKRAISAGAPVPAAVLERCQRMLGEGVEIYTPYGATEALPVASIGSREILAETSLLTRQGRGVCVGRPQGRVRVRIIRIEDGPLAVWSEDLALPAGRVGEIAVQGRVVTRSYFNREDSTALAKIPEEQGGGFWHRMGDLGYLDEGGRLWMCGRKAHRVTTAAGDLFTVCCEGIFNAHPQVFRTALVGVGPAGRQEPVLCVELEDRAADWAAVVGQLRELGAAQEMTRGIRTFLRHPGFPVDIRHNAKIFREKLAVWAGRQ